jgi:putative PIN family toxin of toxin-antitoxin system
VKVVLDTNVVISGIFFGGVPRRVLEAWTEGRFELILTPSIFDEYLATCNRLSATHPGLEFQEVLTNIVGHGTLMPDTASAETITADPDDDKFMICAHGSGAVVVSGDEHLLDVTGWEGITVLTPRSFVDQLGD